MNAEAHYTDEELVAGLSENGGFNDIVLYIYKQFSSAVVATITYNGGSQEDGEDVFQETVVSFIETVRRGKFRGEASVKTFLTVIARNIWMNELRKRQRSGYREKVYESTRDYRDPDISNYISERETKQEFRRMLEKLGEPCNKILLLFYYENLSMKEMLDQLPYENEQVVRNKKYKCLQQLIGIFKDNPGISEKFIKKSKSS
ncbi:MAG: sigma-70 family RNA polymerase sigma factor [Chitinophagaceae bacterium]|nr:sigma-70 family RNA polymerase sigma factor [Chitinophagaceae bacterium]